MRTRPFGRAGWPVSELGFGGWQIGGDWGAVDDDASVRTLLHAFERGVTFVDTAELYGSGHSEEVIGRALRAWRGGKVWVATKAQPVVWPRPHDASPRFRGRFPDWHLRDCVDASLRRLGVERLDLFQLHSWSADGVQALDWLETLNALRLEGKVDQVGVSLRDFRPDEGVGLAELGLVASEQVILNVFEQRPLERLLPAAARSGTAIVARVPLDSGSLTGTWDEGTYATWEEGSQPHRMFRDGRFGDTLARVAALKALCASYYPTLAEAAMRFVLSRPEVSVVIPGMRSPAEVDINLAYADGAPFPPDLAAALPAHGWVRDYYH